MARLPAHLACRDAASDWAGVYFPVLGEAPTAAPTSRCEEAAEVGHGTMLELAAVRKVLADLPRVPADLYLAVNASPETILEKPGACGHARECLGEADHSGADGARPRR